MSLGKKLPDRSLLEKAGTESVSVHDVLSVSYFNASGEWTGKYLSRAGCKSAPCRYDFRESMVIAWARV